MTFSHGGTWYTSRTSTDVDYQVLYLANGTGQPFQQVMALDAAFQLWRGFAVHLGSTVSPTGKPLYTFQIGKVLARSGDAQRLDGSVDVGVHVLRGHVEKPDGKPVEGAVLLIGSQRLYTGPDGQFLYREDKSRSHPFKVLTDEFLTLESYRLLSAPNEVSSSREDAPEIRVLVARIAEPSPVPPTSSALAGEVDPHLPGGPK